MPDWTRELRARLARVPLAPAREAEIVEELSHHLDDRWRELVAAGLDPDAARRQALADFQDHDALARDLTPLRQAHWTDPVGTPQASRWHLFAGLRTDIRDAVRALRTARGFSLAALLLITLGIGANTAIFSVINAVLIRPLPFHDPDRLVVVFGTQGTQGSQGVVYADYVDWREQSRAFDELGAIRGQSVNLTGGSMPERLTGAFVSASLLRLIDARLSQGRLFTEAETTLATTAPVAILSYEIWTSRFAGDPAIVGKPLVVNGTTLTVVGVTAPRMPVPLFSPAPDVMVPIGYYPNAHGLERGTRGIVVIGRLKPRVTVVEAQRDLQTIEVRLAEMYPTTNAGTSAEVLSLAAYAAGPVKAPLFVLFAAVGVVLLIACANVANLQLARGASRAREIAVRAALGAGRWRLTRQLLLESLVLSLVGGLAGVAVAVALTRVLVELIGPTLPVEAQAIHIDKAAFLFALAMSVATGIAFGLPAARRTSNTLLANVLSSRARLGLSQAATRNALVVVQLALSLVLLASAGLLTRSLLALERVDPGFDPDRLLTAQFRLPAATYDTPDKIWAMFDRTIAELRSLPGVESAALVRASPLSGNGETYPVAIEGRPQVDPGRAPSVQLNCITTQYFATMRIPLVAGRDITEDDRAGAAPVVIVNKAFSDQTWPAGPPIGQRIKLGDDQWRTIVGVVGDARHYRLDEPPLLQAYVPHAQRPLVFTSLVVRASGNPLDLVPSVRQAIWRVDPDQPIWRFRSMQEDLDAVVTSPRSLMWLMGAFSLVALLVATIGVYGVLSYTVAQRTQEVGVRMALGANPGRVARMIVMEGLRLAGLAIAVGLVGSFGAARLLRSQLFGVATHDAVTFGLVTSLLAGVALLACYVPARRASRIDPIVALRSE